MENQQFKKLIKEALTPNFLKEGIDAEGALDNLDKWLPNLSPGPFHFYDIIDDGDVDEMVDLIRTYGDEEVLGDYGIDAWDKEDIIQLANYIVSRGNKALKGPVNESPHYRLKLLQKVGDADEKISMDKRANREWLKALDTDDISFSHYSDDELEQLLGTAHQIMKDHSISYIPESVNEVFDPEGDYDIQYEIGDYERGDEVVVLPSLSHDPLNKQGETGEVFDVDTFEKYVIVKFDDGQIGDYLVGQVVFPGDENYRHPEDEGSMNA